MRDPEQDRDELRVSETLGKVMTQLTNERDRWRKLALMGFVFAAVLLTMLLARCLQ